MHSHSLESWQHEHVFLGERHEHNERRTLVVVLLTAATMIVEIVGGTVFGSMALVADGWHMSTHAAALGIAVFAHRFARHHAHDEPSAWLFSQTANSSWSVRALVEGGQPVDLGTEDFGRRRHTQPVNNRRSGETRAAPEDRFGPERCGRQVKGSSPDCKCVRAGQLLCG